MKRMLPLLIALLMLIGCDHRRIAPSDSVSTASPTAASTAILTETPTIEPRTPAPTQTPRPTDAPTAVPTAAPTAIPGARFMEELLSWDGEPVGSIVRRLLDADGLTKASFCSQFTELIERMTDLDAQVVALSQRGRTLTVDWKAKTVRSLSQLMDDGTLDALQAAYARCSGEGEALPLQAYAEALIGLIQDVEGMEDRTATFFQISSARDYLSALSRYMGGAVSPDQALIALESLTQTEAYAIAAAQGLDPEAARKQVVLTFGSPAEDMAFLGRVTRDLYDLPDGYPLPPFHAASEAGYTDLFELAFRWCPGMAFLHAYAAQLPEGEQVRWAQAYEEYLAGIAVHASYAVVPYLGDFGVEYARYRWYEGMLEHTLTGITALLLHYYGYTKDGLSEYLAAWGAADFTDFLYDKAMADPFESLVAAYGYSRYLDICEAALDAGCDSEARFLRDYLAAGPMPFEELKGHMVAHYQNQG